MALRLRDELAASFDAWAADRGGRSPALRHLIARACAAKAEGPATPFRLATRPVKLTRSAWVAALVRRRLVGKPTFARSDQLALLAIQAEFQRVGVNINQIARALNTGVVEGKTLELEIAYLDDLRTEIAGHMTVLWEAHQRLGR